EQYMCRRSREPSAPVIARTLGTHIGTNAAARSSERLTKRSERVEIAPRRDCDRGRGESRRRSFIDVGSDWNRTLVLWAPDNWRFGTSAWIRQQRARLRKAIMCRLRRRIDGQRAREERLGGGSVARLKEERAGVDVHGGVAGVRANRRLERRSRAVPLAGGRARPPRQPPRPRLGGRGVDDAARGPHRRPAFSTQQTSGTPRPF